MEGGREEGEGRERERERERGGGREGEKAKQDDRAATQLLTNIRGAFFKSTVTVLCPFLVSEYFALLAVVMMKRSP